MSEETKFALRQDAEREENNAVKTVNPARVSSVGGFIQNHKYAILSLLSITTFLIIWELAPRLGLVRPLFTSSPSRIAAAAIALAYDDLWYNIGVTLAEFILGFGLAVVVGIPFGVLLGWNRTVQALFEPYITTLYSVPRIALMPLIILWLGIGIYSKIAVVFLGAVFPIIINVFSGMHTLDEGLVRCARAFGADDHQLLRTVALPWTVPFMISGVRLGVGRALVGVIVAEFVASQAGIGYMMARAGTTFQTDKVFVGVIFLALMGLTLTEMLKRLEARFGAWRLGR